MILFSTGIAHERINDVYGDYRNFITSKEFSTAFKEWNATTVTDLADFIDGGYNDYSNYGTDYRICRYKNFDIIFKMVGDYGILFCDYIFRNLEFVYQSTVKEKLARGKGKKKRPQDIRSSGVEDYMPVNHIKGGYIDNIPVQIVQRKNIKAPDGNPVFNYFHDGKILGKYDFASPFPFERNNDTYEAKAYGISGYCYLVYYPQTRTVKKKLVEGRNCTKIRLTEGDLHRVIKRCVNQVLRYYMS